MQEFKMLKVVVASGQLGRVTLGKKGLSPADTVPISTRMNDLENTVKNLCESFEKFRKSDKTKREDICKHSICIASGR